MNARGNLKYLIGAFVIVIAVALLTYTTTQSSMVYYVTVSELKSQSASQEPHSRNALQSGPVRVAGRVVAAPLADDTGTMLSFSISENSDVLPVVVKGPLPDGVKIDADVVVEGQLNAAGVFEGSKVLAKCPSKYEGTVQ